LKTLHILHSEAATGWGGQEIRIFQECQLLLDQGHKVSIVCQPNSILRNRCKTISSQNFNCYALRMKNPVNLFSILSFSKIIKRARPDLIHTHSSIDSWLAGIVGKILGVPIIRSRHISIPIKKNFVNNWLYSNIPKKIITSGEAISKIVSSVPGVDRAKVKSISAGVDFKRFDFNIDCGKIKKELNINSNQSLIGKIGVIRGWKGYDYFVDCAPLVLEQFPEARFVIVGSGPGYKSIQSKVKNKNLEKFIFLLGHREDIPEIMGGIDIQILASYSGEGTPQVIPQAFAMKTPLVATSVGSVPELLGHGERGILVEPKNSEDLAKGILRFLKDRQTAQAVAENAYTYCLKELNIEKMMDQTIAVYRDALNES
tara:strand:- start:458 stop:1573 length:1116 start_codon:yes stop_codon:yes gene_type:complete